AVRETMAALPLQDLPGAWRAPILATRTRLGFGWVFQQSTATPVRRLLSATATLMVALIACAYLLAANAYYVDTFARSSGQEVIVVRRGLPWLPLPGIGQSLLVDTGIDADPLAEAGRTAILNRRVWGLWQRRSAAGEPQWVSDVTQALRAQN